MELAPPPIQPAWLPRVNLEGRPTIQPHPNPYVPHWEQYLGQFEDVPRSTWIGLGIPFGAALVGTLYGAIKRPLRGEEAAANAMYGAGLFFLLGTIPGLAVAMIGPGVES